ncbi:MAG: archease [Thermodesulfobacteriota bacterium]|nr:archease [Thermodesulfobacteriota bacterium]
MKEEVYEITDHTADLGVRVYGNSLKELFSNTGFAFFDLLVDLGDVREKNTFCIEITGDDLQDLMVNFLRELIYLHYVKGYIFKRFETVCVSNGKVLQIKAFGEDIDVHRHIIKDEIKAITYHNLMIEEEGNSWIANMIFDV